MSEESNVLCEFSLCGADAARVVTRMIDGKVSSLVVALGLGIQVNVGL